MLSRILLTANEQSRKLSVQMSSIRGMQPRMVAGRTLERATLSLISLLEVMCLHCTFDSVVLSPWTTILGMCWGKAYHFYTFEKLMMSHCWAAKLGRYMGELNM